jgi:hypothetical protein
MFRTWPLTPAKVVHALEATDHVYTRRYQAFLPRRRGDSSLPFRRVRVCGNAGWPLALHILAVLRYVDNFHALSTTTLVQNSNSFANRRHSLGFRDGSAVCVTCRHWCFELCPNFRHGGLQFRIQRRKRIQSLVPSWWCHHSLPFWCL